MPLLRILGGLVLVGIGSVFLLKTEWFMQNIGAIEWFEQKLGSSGGSRLGYKLIGLIIIFIGLLAMTGMLGGFLLGSVGRLFVAPK